MERTSGRPGAPVGIPRNRDTRWQVDKTKQIQIAMVVVAVIGVILGFVLGGWLWALVGLVAGWFVGAALGAIWVRM
ncbi:MAG: hypothetical protein ACPHQB_07870 [Miltoncostaeaceae bacterium]|jgi:outer membrane lipoprotein SlyB